MTRTALASVADVATDVDARTATRLVRIDEVSGKPTATGVTVVARKHIVRDEPYLEGHFPGRAVYPGVFVIEAVKEAAAAVLQPPRGLDVVSVRSVRFLRPVLPGDELVVCADIVTNEPLRWSVDATCTTAAGRAATVKIDVAAMPEDLPADECIGLLPHGQPMVLIDRVLDLATGRFIVASKAVSVSEPCFAGLAPARAASATYPNDLVIESFGQAAAILWLVTAGAPPLGSSVLMFAAARDIAITRTVRPGDVMRHIARLDHRLGDSAFVEGETFVDGDRVATFGSMVAVKRPADAVVGTADHPTARAAPRTTPPGTKE